MPSTTISRTMPSLPAGFRFHPTDEELIVHYLMNQAASIPCPVPIIAEVNIYQCNPWDLPPKALFGENEWYFFSPRDRKYPNGARPNRAAGSGYWKATGTDKAILSTPTSENVGVKKALVFYRGKPPKGIKTDWIMHEYRLTDASNTVNKKNAAKRRGSSPSSMRLDDWVLCRIYKKSNNFQFSDPREEQDGSTVEEAEPSLNNDNMNGTVASPKSEETVHHATTDDLQLFHNQQLSMTKSCSLTDLLNTIDYTALFFDAPPETEPQQSSLIYTSSPSHQPPNNYNMNSIMPQVDDALCSDYGGASSYNSLNRKRIMTASSFDDGGSSFTKKLPQLPSDSMSGTFFGSSSSYCNQQLAEAASTSSFQYSGLLSHPFLNQQLLLNDHLGMQ